MSEEREKVRMIISGGGTGGHLFPGIAVAERVLRRFPGAEMLFVGTERQTDARVLANRSFEVTSISCLGLKGKGGLTRLKALAKLPFSLLQALSIMKRFRPALVLGVGGYVTGPVLLAAKLKGIATCIHEQNSVPGMANRVLGKFVDRIFLSMPGSEQYFPVGKRVLTGNPVRGELLGLAELRKKENADNLTLLVLGGSLGARKVNSLVTEALASMKEDLPKGFRVIHQTGSHDEEQVRKRYEKDRISCKVSAFFTDMVAVYAKADLVVSRAGATSLAEMTVLGKPMILIPYPYAADNHQEKNGRWLVNGGAARMLVEKDLSAEQLKEEIKELLASAEKRKGMAEAARRIGRPDATDRIVDECLQLMKRSS
ncbi:MAG: undecaprenyldiphospho-muramoylpentapeptide beta-N-acetylglucosaminyltransferase [Desulfobulbaceae bacterium]|nr:undecaprenyldiphospho-muramoylpentapeptide beta-N-acetylglucosaminyltransferase [Desulfobulbaceae bacterium]